MALFKHNKLFAIISSVLSGLVAVFSTVICFLVWTPDLMSLFYILFFFVVFCNIGSIVVTFLVKKNGLKLALQIVLTIFGVIFCTLYSLPGLAYEEIVKITGVMGNICAVINLVLVTFIFFKNRQNNSSNDETEEAKTAPEPSIVSNETTKYLDNSIEKLEGEKGEYMEYTHLEVRPKDFDKKVNALAAEGWKVVAQSESAWVINKCCGLSNTVDSIINVTLGR